MSQSKRGAKVKTKRSKQWGKRVHAALVRHLINADPEYAFEAAVLGERGMQEKYTRRELKRLIDVARMRGRNPVHVTLPQGVTSVHVTTAGGGGAGGSGGARVSSVGGGRSHAVDALLPLAKFLVPPPKKPPPFP